ncbi:MAG: glycosyltransferase [Moorea sp. SIOASIH]|uniref:glycosyltransferase n=1 Tax=Moorena sp. SIOASIH TaxID=2607817 RepID=UPI0013BD8918|nr:glycosyltransferase [Moorena sp. SIOASIH]NEO36151.1 glycosyltransferase [Moorena sp. SIOASIH]
MSNTANTLLIVEEALRDLKAHWFEYIKTITQAAEAQGWQVQVGAHHDVVPEICQELKVFPLFRYARYLDNQKKKLPGERYYGFLLHSWRCLVVLVPLLGKQPRYEHIFVPTVLIHHLLAWWMIMTFHPQRPQHLTLFFVANPGIWDRNIQKSILPSSPLLGIQRFLLRRFQKLVAQGTVTLAVETKGAKREFEELTNLPFQLFPHPVPQLTESSPLSIRLSSTQESSSAPTFACYGFARYEKGSDMFKTAIEQLLSQQQDIPVQFCIQWVEPFSLPDGSICEPGSLLRQHPQVTIIDRPLQSHDYQTLLSKTDCMILPYRNSSYHARVSRVAIEAVCLGIPLIYTKGGWLEEIVSEFGSGIGIEDECTQELTQAIITLGENLAEYTQLALGKRAKAQQYFSPANFCQQLLSPNKI